ncbi:MAG: LysM peptidoglycan-binding domain-containing protein [Candidatus Sericytochromatia bacterium]|nr:LysM peptidoglycan-binding domain-containing protein [Candidatus Sericytochromatia bacterium]
MTTSSSFPSRKKQLLPEVPAGVDPIGAFLVNQRREYSVSGNPQRYNTDMGERITDLGEVARVLSGCLAADQQDDDLVVELLMLESMLADVPVKSKEILEQLGDLGEEVRESLVPPGVINVASLRRRTRRLRQQIGALASRISAALVLFLTGAPNITQDALAAEESVNGYAVANAPLVKVIDSLTGQGVAGVQIKTMEERLLGVTDTAGQATLGDGYLETDLLSFEKDGYDMYLLDRTQMSSRNIVSMKPLKALQANSAGAKGAAASTERPRTEASDPLGVTRPAAIAKAPEPPRVVPPKPGQAPVLQPPRQPSKPQPPALKLPVRPRTKAAESAGHAHASAPAKGHGGASHGHSAAKPADTHHGAAAHTREVRLPTKPRSHAAHSENHGHASAPASHAAHKARGHGAVHRASAGTATGAHVASGHSSHGASAHSSSHKVASGHGHSAGAHHGQKSTGHGHKSSAHHGHKSTGHGQKADSVHAHKVMSSPVLPRRPKASYHAAHGNHGAHATHHVAVPHHTPRARLHANVASHSHGSNYRVRPGDSLSSIASQTLGSANRWREIYNANRGEIANPRFIQVGQVLHLPGHTSHASGGVYRVKRGDSLYTIASTHLGHGHKWQDIWNLNRDKIRNARLIYPGQVLTLPHA